MSMVEFGMDTFGDVSNGPDGQPQPMHVVLNEVVEEGVLADQVGVDFIGLGEHHRSDFALASPEIVLAAIAAKTTRIKLGTAVTVLSSDDPVRVFQRFSTLNAISGGRAEPILGRGSFTESYPLFGFDLADYDQLFEEKLDLFTRLLREKQVTWSGQTRSALTAQTVYPPLAPQGMVTWVGVGGSPESVVRAVRQDLQLMLAIIGGDPRRFLPYLDLYARACEQMGTPRRPVGVHSPGHIAATDEQARAELWPHYQTMFGRIGRERGWPPTTKERFIDEVEKGSLYVGSPQTVARKLAATVGDLGIQRFNLKMATGPMPKGQILASIQHFGQTVIPMARDILSSRRKT